MLMMSCCAHNSSVKLLKSHLLHAGFINVVQKEVKTAKTLLRVNYPTIKYLL